MPDHRNAPGGGGEAGAALGIYGERDTIPGQRASRRTRRWLEKELQRASTDSISSRLCGLPMGPVTVEISDVFIAHVSGIGHCGSPWSCPICAPVIRERVAQEYNELAVIADSLGWSMVFVVGTLRHHRGDGLAAMLSVVSPACHDSLKGRWWETFKREHHYAGMLRTIEIDFGWVNGWHPHFQSLLFFRGALSDADVSDLGAWWWGRWNRIATAAGFGPLVAEGLVAERLRAEDRIGDYLVKPAGSWGIGREMARGDVKRHGELFPAFDLLAPDTTALWKEYEAATFGRRFRMPAKGLRSELLSLSEEKSDVELAAAEGLSGTRVLFRVEVGALEWVQYVDSGLVGWFLENLELAALAVALMASVMGHEVVGPEYSVAEVEAARIAQRAGDVLADWKRGQRNAAKRRRDA